MAAQIDGVNAVIAKLNELEKKVGKKIARKMVSKGSSILLKDAKRRCKSKLIKRSLGRKIVQKKNISGALAVVGPRKGFKDAAGNDPVNVAHLLEGGRRAVSAGFKHVLRGAKGAKRAVQQKTGAWILASKRLGKFFGKSVRAARAQPFLGPAVLATKYPIGQEMARVGRDEIAKQGTGNRG